MKCFSQCSKTTPSLGCDWTKSTGPFVSYESKKKTAKYEEFGSRLFFFYALFPPTKPGNISY